MGAIVSSSPQPSFRSSTGNGNERERRPRIFEKNSSFREDMNLSSVIPNASKEFDEETYNLLTGALRKFFFLEKESSDSGRMALLLSAMSHEDAPRGTYLLREGEAGENADKMYILESGDVQVTINDIKIRQMSRGSLLGELALLYDAPRSATVRCLTDCTLWSLQRAIFKQIQTVAASASLLQRSKWVFNIFKNVTNLGSVEVSRLVRTMQSHVYKGGEILMNSGELTNKCVLVEKGELAIPLSSAMMALPMPELDRRLGIVRPAGGRRISTSAMTFDQLKTYLFSSLTPTVSSGGKKIDDRPLESEKCVNYEDYIIHEGCFLGLGVLKARAGIDVEDNEWIWRVRTENKKQVEGAECPFTAKAVKNGLQCSYFTVDTLERLFGPILKLLDKENEQRSSPHAHPHVSGYLDLQPSLELSFDSTKFHTISILGKGSFGVVTMAEYRVPGENTKMYALKTLVKAVVLETGQIRHVLDERHLLAQMNCPFIIRLFGTFQTNDTLVMVNEAVTCGDLWGVLYENPLFRKPGGLPRQLVRFYSMSIVLALAHIHGKGVAYRDLKPENIMIDEQGYLRVIDFGFAKKIPFSKVEANGEMKMHLKSYTLCGTPGTDIDAFFFVF
jgi:CRP-like cAMP-binding protein